MSLDMTSLEVVLDRVLTKHAERWFARTAPRERPTQDVSDELLESTIHRLYAQWPLSDPLLVKLTEIQHARAAQRGK